MKRTMIAITAMHTIAGTKKIDKTIAFVISYHMSQPATVKKVM